jgi:hypothetical protein
MTYKINFKEFAMTKNKSYKITDRKLWKEQEKK